MFKLFRKKKVYVLAHVVITDSASLRRITTKVFPTMEQAKKTMEKRIQELVCIDNETLYYTAWINEEDGAKIVIHDVTHYFQIEAGR